MPKKQRSWDDFQNHAKNLIRLKIMILIIYFRCKGKYFPHSLRVRITYKNLI